MTRCSVSNILLRLHKRGLDCFVVVGEQQRNNVQPFHDGMMRRCSQGSLSSRRYLSDSNKNNSKRKPISVEEAKPSSSMFAQDVINIPNQDKAGSNTPLEKSASGTSTTSDSTKTTAHEPTATLPAPSTTASSSISIALSNFLKRLQSTLEESSGLTELVHLKQAVQDASRQFDVATQKVAECRIHVAQSQKAHEQAHKRHVTLLMRRDEWNADDAQQFVTMTSEEVMTRQTLLESQEQLRRAEDFALQCQHDYMDKMRQRYHEEQMWQDKWRLLSTYGTWSLIVINTMVFLIGQYRANRREMNRLSHMEKLLLASQQQQSYNRANYGQETAATTHPSEDDDHDKVPSTTKNGVKEDETDASVSMQQQESNGYDGAASGEATTGICKESSKHEYNNSNSLWAKYFRYHYDWKEMPMHTPSVAVGAVLGASCVFVLSLMAGSGKR